MIYDNIPAGGDTWFTFPIDYDNRVLTCTMYWNEAVEGIHDRLVRQARDDAFNDPILDADGRYVRDYSVFEYYQAGNPLTTVDMYNEWYDSHKDNLPMSLRNRLAMDVQRTVMSRSVTYYQLNREISSIYEMCVWTFSIIDEGHTVTGVVAPGGLYTRDDGWSMWVRSSTRERIGRNDLNHVYLEFL